MCTSNIIKQLKLFTIIMKYIEVPKQFHFDHNLIIQIIVMVSIINI